MRAGRLVLLSLCLLIEARLKAQDLPRGPVHDSGDSVTGAYEGWFQNPDGTFTMLVGYFNRNRQEVVDIPIGPNNRIDPGGPDHGQPTHFLTRRQWGMFMITVPKDFGDKKLIWTIVANGKTTALPLDLNPLWEVMPFSEVGMGNTPPILRFEENGPSVQGPRPFAKTLTATAGSPLPLTVWVADDAKTFPGAKPPNSPPITVTWTKFRGQGKVTFANDKPAVELDKSKATAELPAAGKSTTSATFSEPGEYTLLVVINDWSGEGGRGFLCCWTNGEVQVTVKSAR